MAFRVVWERMSAWLRSPTAAKWLSKWSGGERLLCFPSPQPQNGSPGGLGESVCLVSHPHNLQIACQLVWEKMSAWLSSPTTAKWLSKWSGIERLLGLPLPQPPNGSPGGLGENVCLVSLSHSHQMAFQVVWERTSAWFPSPTAAKWVSKWSGRERLLRFPHPQPPSGSPSGLEESVCLVSLSQNRQMALQVVWERASAWFPFPAAAKWLPCWSGRECLLGLPSPTADI